MINDLAFMAEFKRLAAGARYLTSVCTGSLVLGAAGLSKGKRAACHWAWRDMLPLFGAIPDAGRVVRDGNVITGGGVKAGIDFALVVAAELSGETFAQALQGNIEYAPAPPFDLGRPETAPPDALAMSRARYAKLLPGRTPSRARKRRRRGCEERRSSTRSVMRPCRERPPRASPRALCEEAPTVSGVGKVPRDPSPSTAVRLIEQVLRRPQWVDSCQSSGPKQRTLSRGSLEHQVVLSCGEK